MRRLPIAAIAALLVCGAGVAHAGAPTVRLDGGLDVEACPLPAVRTQVIATLGRDPFADDAPVIVRVETARDGAGVTARVDTGTADVRQLTAPDCDQLTRSIAVAIVLLVESAAPAPPQAPVLDEVVAGASAPARSHVDADFLVGGAGAVDGATVAPQLVAGARVRRNSASLAGEIAFQAPSTIDVTQTARVTVSTLSLSVAPCVHAGSVAFCAVLTAGWTHGTGTGLVEARSSTAPLAAGGIRTEWEHPLSPRITARLFAEMSALATTTRYLVDQMPVWTSPRYEARFGVGVAAKIP